LPGTYMISLTVTDSGGGIGFAPPVTIIVTPPTPVVTIQGTPASGQVGTPVSLTSTVTETGLTPTLTYAWQAVVGNSTVATGSNSSFSFTPGVAGQYVVTLNVSDTLGGTGTNSVAFTVNALTPDAVIGGAPTSSPEGTLISLVSAAANQNVIGPLSYTWSVTKNGSPFASATTAVFNFPPDHSGVYQAFLTVTDGQDHSTAATPATITVTNVPPTASITGFPASAQADEPVTITGTATDPGAADIV